jgi:D-glycero-D-manno-heptose 1,7-bisphosphate phosphatase
LTVFIDRDGVINRRRVADWVKDWDEFEMLPGVPQALKLLKDQGFRLVLITNQRAIALNLFSREHLNSIHEKMNQAIIERGGAAFDAIYVCPHDRPDNCNCRKPQPGMFFQASADFPDIVLSDCYMFGDSESDRVAAEAAGCKGFYKIDDAHSLLDRVTEFLR